MKKIALTCKDPGKFFHDCKDCEYYDQCDYFQKIDRKNPPKIPINSILLDDETGEMCKWNGKEWIQIYPKKKEDS